MPLRIAFGGLGEGQPFQVPGISLDQVVVDGDVQTERLGGRRRGVVGALQRRGDHGGDPAALRQIPGCSSACRRPNSVSSGLPRPE